LRIIAPSVNPSFGWPASVPGQAAGVTQCCLESLLRSDNKGTLYPWLAESYKIAEDYTSMTFNLRKGVKFHDGSDFNAAAAKWNLDNYIAAHMEPTWTSVDVIDDYTIRVNFTKWANTIPYSFGDATYIAYMISKTAFDTKGKDWVKQNPVGTGPFKFVSYGQDTKLVFEKNADYWKKDERGNQLPYLDGITYLFMNEPLTQKMSMKAGEADMASSGIAAAGKSASEMAAMGLSVNTLMNELYGLVFDTADADSPWAKQQVREAAEYAIDREAMAVSFGYGYLKAPYQLVPRGSLAYNPDFTLARKYDPEKAKQLLAEAGYPDGFKTTIICFPLGLNKDVVVAVQNYLSKVGIQAELDFPEIGRWVSYWGSNNSWPSGQILYEAVGIGSLTASGLQFVIDNMGKSWAKTPELTQSYQAALNSPSVDVSLLRAVTDTMYREASLVSVIEGGAGVAAQTWVMDTGYFERGDSSRFNCESVWLNK
jgi:peptide/nickel transport system substrate-binding protein